MEKEIKELIETIIGIIFILIGILGLFLPIIPGIVFIIAGAALVTHHPIKKVISNLRRNYKKKR